MRELEYCVIDLETSGLYVERGEKIIEIGAVRIRNFQVQETDFFQSLVNPEREISQESIAIHGITNEELKNAPSLREVLPRFQDFLAGSIPVAQNAKFDLGFIRVAAAEHQCPRIHVPYLDTMLVSKNLLFHYTQGHGLDAIARRLRVQKKWDRHRSIGDCLLTATCLIEMIKELEKLGKGSLKDVESCFISLPKLEVAKPSGGNLSLF